MKKEYNHISRIINPAGTKLVPFQYNFHLLFDTLVKTKIALKLIALKIKIIRIVVKLGFQ